jgi:hypothetical protein
MGNLLGSKRAASRRSALAGLIAAPILLSIVSCGGGGDDESDNPFVKTDENAAETTETTELQPCSENRHLVVFDIIGLLTLGDYAAITRWNEEGVYPDARPGSAETAQAYRQRGYEVLYVTTLPSDSIVDGMPAADAMAAWLTAKGFPMEAEITRVWTMDATAGGRSWSNISNELLRLSGEGVSIDAGYTENSDKAYGLATGGVPTEGLFTLASLPVEGRREQDTPDYPVGPPSTPIANDDFVTHAAEVAQQPPVCQA